MLARRDLPDRFRAWNRRWGAPDGYPHRGAHWLGAHAPALAARVPQLGGPFSLQLNNNTRVYEYPWAFHAAPVHAGLSIVEIGGGLSGFQFVLAKQGASVVNVDPGEAATGFGWHCDPESIARLNRAFRTNVQLRNTTLADAGLADASVDRIYSISTVEHIPTDELPGLARDIRRVLRPGGEVVMTIDLFLDVAPFTRRVRNQFGWNADVKAFVDELGFERVVGDERELHGYPAFDPEHVLIELPELLYGSYPACVQLLVLSKPA
jgi:SAM-dependent methyltransferase